MSKPRGIDGAKRSRAVLGLAFLCGVLVLATGGCSGSSSGGSGGSGGDGGGGSGGAGGSGGGGGTGGGGGGGGGTGCDRLAPVGGTPHLTLEKVVDGLREPLLVTAPASDVHRLFVVEQGGRIRVARDGTLVDAPFLDVSAEISSGGERGLLGLAFHPDYAKNGRFFVDYTSLNGNIHVSEFQVSSNPDVADPASEHVLLEIEHPLDNHNGGNVIFGPDGKLYVGVGDGGGGGDPNGHGQSLSTLLGKILRIDVDSGDPYGIPADNPFADRADARGEIYVYGVRNPWRFSFDRATRDLWIGDVGQDAREEIDASLAGSIAGNDYGWNVMEGTACFNPPSGCDTTGLTLPVIDYDHSKGCAVTGGFVYRGARMPGIQGTYFFTDFCSGFTESLKLQGGHAAEVTDRTSELGTDGISVSSYGEDACGELYLASQAAG